MISLLKKLINYISYNYNLIRYNVILKYCDYYTVDWTAIRPLGFIQLYQFHKLLNKADRDLDKLETNAMNKNSTKQGLRTTNEITKEQYTFSNKITNEDFRLNPIKSYTLAFNNLIKMFEKHLNQLSESPEPFSMDHTTVIYVTRDPWSYDILVSGNMTIRKKIYISEEEFMKLLNTN